MRALKISTLILGLALVFGTACKKYEEGPSMSLRTKKARIVNTWTIEKTVSVDGNESVATQENKDALNFEIKKDNTLTYSYSSDGFSSSQSGKWEFSSDKEKIIFTFPNGVVQETTIILLKNNEWATRDSDGFKTYYVAK